MYLEVLGFTTVMKNGSDIANIYVYFLWFRGYFENFSNLKY